MSGTDDIRRRIADALEDARDGVLEATELEAVRELLRTEPEARQAYLQFNDLTRLLESSDDVESPAELEVERPSETEPENVPVATSVSVPDSPRRRRLWLGFVVVALVPLAVIVSPTVITLLSGPVEFATLVASKGGTWSQTSYPTQPGTRLGTGRMQIATGLVTLDFDHGVEVVLEGPVDFELLASDRCRLYSGSFVATAREGGEGFAVETPDGVVIDRGTSFGVKTGPGGTDVVVFSGRVDVAQPAEDGESTLNPLVAGQQVRMDDEGLGKVRQDVEIALAEKAETETKTPAEVQQITSARGLGRDGWVQRGPVDPKKSREDVILVNRTVASLKDWERMGVITFDVRRVEFDRVSEAEVVLQLAATGLGYASRIGDAEFRVYGLTDGSRDYASEKSHQWNKAPWRRFQDGHLNSERTMHVGTFTVKQGQTGSVTFGRPELLEFLRNDKNKRATLLIVRHTRPDRIGALVHGFASSRHDTLRPPTLRLTLSSSDE